MEKIKLKPCPFCGKEPEIVNVEIPIDFDVLIRCANSKTHVSLGLGWGKEKAIKAWNRRTIR